MIKGLNGPRGPRGVPGTPGIPNRIYHRLVKLRNILNKETFGTAIGYLPSGCVGKSGGPGVVGVPLLHLHERYDKILSILRCLKLDELKEKINK